MSGPGCGTGRWRLLGAALPVAPAAVVSGAPALARSTPQTPVSNTGQAAGALSLSSVVDSLRKAAAREFTIGGAAGAPHPLHSVQLQLNGYDGADSARASIRTASSSNPGALLYALDNPDPITSDSLNAFTAPSTAVLSANTPQFVVVEALNGSFDLSFTTSPSEGSGGVSGSTIASERHFASDSGATWISTATSLLRMAVRRIAPGRRRSRTRSRPRRRRAGAAFDCVVPATTFADADPGDTLTCAAELSDGTALPARLSFDPEARTFSGTPGEAEAPTVTGGGGRPPPGAVNPARWNPSLPPLPVRFRPSPAWPERR